MGYTTDVNGEFAIEPPLTWPEFKDSRYSPDNITSTYTPSLVLRISEERVDTAEGPLLRRTATALAMREIDEYRERGLVDEVQDVLDAFPGHTFSGRLQCEGEENTDIWRVAIRDGRAIRVDPQIVWPDEPLTADSTSQPRENDVTRQDDYDPDDDQEQDDGEEQTEGDCDRCTGSTPEDLERAISGASIAPVCACAIGQGASPEDCVCGPEQEGSEDQ